MIDLTHDEYQALKKMVALIPTVIRYIEAGIDITIDATDYCQKMELCDQLRALSETLDIQAGD